jgi:serine/threonine-protein kinase
MSGRLSVIPKRYLGDILTGGYRLDRMLGVGGFAAVYHARRFDGAGAAVKVLLSDAAQAGKRFAREIKVMQSLPPSPMLVGYLGHGLTDDGRPFLVMEHVDGPTLAQGLRSRPILPQDEAVVVLYQIALSLEALHRYGVVHRDVKPNNVLVAPNGVVKLFDFGLVLDAEGILKLLEEEDILAGADFSEDIERGAVAGTPEYMAPEQFHAALTGAGPAGQLTAATDVFSLGVMLFRLLTGVLPHPLRRGRGALTTRLVMAYMKSRTEAIARLQRPAQIDRSLWSIVVRALSEDPAERQQNSKALSADLFGYLVLGTGTRRQDGAATQVTSGFVPRPPSSGRGSGGGDGSV